MEADKFIISDLRGIFKEEKATSTYYHVCPVCGANLDPGEICDCLKKKASDLIPVSWRTFSTGDPRLDVALGIDGLPMGKIVEIYGPEYTGKTSLALQIAHQVDNALYIDADYGLNPNDAKGLYLAHADTLEDALRMVEIAAPAFNVVVIDTLTALPTASQAALPISYQSGAVPQAKVLARCLPRLIRVLDKTRCTLVAVNQVREAAGQMYGNIVHSTGGRALKNFAAVRLEVYRTSVVVKKNKYAPAERRVAA